MPAVPLLLLVVFLSSCAVPSTWETESQHWHDRVTRGR